MDAIPPPPITRLLLGRGIVLWIVLRFAFSLSAALVGPPLGPPALRVAPVVALALAALAATLALLDLHRRHEVLFLANVGVSQRAAALVAALPAVAAELVVALGALA